MSDLQKLTQSYQEGQFETFVKLSEKFRPQEDHKQSFLEMKGRALQKIGRFEDALGTWNVLLSMHPENAYYYGERGVCKFNLQYKSAIDDISKAIELEPNDGYHYACRAYVKDKLGDTEGCIQDYKRSLELDPDNEVTLNNLGLAEEKLGYTQQARDRFRQADELMGIETIETRQEPIAEAKKPEDRKKALWDEVRTMISSPKEFMRFIRELFGKDQ